MYILEETKHFTNPNSNNKTNNEERPGARVLHAQGILWHQRDKREHGVAGNECACAKEVDGAHLAQLVSQQAQQQREDHLAEGIGCHHEAIHGQRS